MDDVIYEEFKGHRQHGNPPGSPHGREARLSPAINVNRSGTPARGTPADARRAAKDVGTARKLLYNMDDLEAMEFLLDKIKATKTNNEFFDSMRR